jgi:phage gp36-like protein
MQVLIKQPSEALKRELPFVGGGAIAAIIEVSSAARELVAGSAALVVAGTLTAGMLFVTIEGGTDGERYLVTARVTTAAGEEREGEMEVAVLDREWAMPDGGAAYLSIGEFVDRFGLEEAVRMTDQDGSGRIDRQFLVSALAAVQSVADAYLAGRFAVPLAEVPEVVKTAIADMVRARLYPRGAPEGVAEQGKAGLRILERLADGRLTLPTLSPAAPAPSTTPILLNPGQRRYGAGELDSY